MIELQRFVERAAPLGALGVMITRRGERVAEHFFEGSHRRNLYSASKSYTSLAVGIALREGLLSLEEKLIDVFSEELPGEVPKNLQKAVVRDLLTMCMGQETSCLMATERPFYQEKNWVKLVLSRPFALAPGKQFVYNNAGPYLAGVLVQRRAGCDLVHYLMPRLFEPLGIPLPTWETDPLGYTFGAGGLFLCIQEFHRFGELCLRQGEWNGRQLVPAEWLREACKKQVENDRDSYGYGYLFWGGPEGSFRADGMYFQQSILLRDKEAVITITAENRDGDSLERAVFEELYPQL